MPIYNGPLNVLQDGQGSVIPVALSPTDVPLGQSLTIDVSRLQPPSGSFGYIAGVTVDATGANIAAGIVSLAFDGGYALTRNANGGNTQVYRVSGPVLRLTITNLAWTSGTINFVVWNSQPTNELQSPLTVVASGAVSISGTPTVQFAAGQSVSIAAGNVNVGTVSGTVTVEPGAHNLAIHSLQVLVAGNSVALVGAGINGTIRSIAINAASARSFGPNGSVQAALTNSTLGPLYWNGFMIVTNRPQDYVTIVSLTGLAIPFTNGLTFECVCAGGLTSVDSLFYLNAIVGWN